jgi:hypothetical protein
MSGVRNFWEVFLAPNMDATLRTSYVETRKPNPILDQLPGALKTFKWESMVPFGYESREKPKPFVAAQISYISLPYERGVVVMKDDAKLPATISDSVQESIRKKALELESTYLQWEGKLSPCAKELASRLYEVVKPTPEDPKSPTSKLKPLAVEGVPAQLQWQQLRQQFETATSQVMLGASCETSVVPTAVQIESMEAAKRVHDGFLSLATPPEASKATATWTYENVPLERLGLAALAGAITSPDSSDRVKFSGANLVKNPLNQVLAAIALNVHFCRFDPKAEKPTPCERWRGFVGAAFTPEFGAVGGVGYGVLRNMSVNVGMGLLRVDALKPGDSLGSPPSDPDDPFDEKWESVGFFALGFNF